MFRIANLVSLRSRSFLLLATLLLGTLGMSPAMATCTLTDAFSGLAIPNPMVSYVDGFGINIDATMPNGTVLKQVDVTATSASGAAGIVTCPEGLGDQLTKALLPYYTGYPNQWIYFQTPINGLALQVLYGGINLDRTDHFGSAPRFTTPQAPTFTLRFIKVGEITASGVVTGDLVLQTMQANTANPFPVSLVTLRSPIYVIVNVPTCTVGSDSQNMVVTLDSASASDLTGNGTAGSKDFAISLACAGGSVGTVTNMYMTFTDANSPGNVSDHLTQVSTGAAATGAAIQVLYKGSPVSFGPDSSAKGNPGQFFVQRAANGAVSIPFTARYVTTGDPITAGAVRSIATFTMSYQ